MPWNDRHKEGGMCGLATAWHAFGDERGADALQQHAGDVRVGLSLGRG